MRWFTRKMPAYKNVPISWGVYSMVISRIQVNHTVKKAFLWAEMKIFKAWIVRHYIQLWWARDQYKKIICIYSEKVTILVINIKYINIDLYLNKTHPKVLIKIRNLLHIYLWWDQNLKHLYLVFGSEISNF